MLKIDTKFQTYNRSALRWAITGEGGAQQLGTLPHTLSAETVCRTSETCAVVLDGERDASSTGALETNLYE